MYKLILSFILTLLFNLVSAQSSLIINEVMTGVTGNREYIELIALNSNPCETVDLRGWIIDDNNGTFGFGTGKGISTGYLKFTQDPLLSNIKSGTIILIWNYSEQPAASLGTKAVLDTVSGDYLLIFPIGCQIDCPSTKYITALGTRPTTSDSTYTPATSPINGGWSSISLSNSNPDAAQTRLPDSKFHFGLSWRNDKHPDSLVYGLDSLNRPLFLMFREPIQIVYQMTNNFSFDPRNKRNWLPLSNIQTPGEPNSPNNSNYIQSLRPTRDTSLFQICVQGDTTLQIGDQNVVVNGNQLEYFFTTKSIDGCDSIVNVSIQCPLPVELVSFFGYQENLKNKLEWRTASEFNNEKFIIQRSEGERFYDIGMVQGFNQPSRYQFIDDDFDPSYKVIYYRLKQVDFDGRFEYSDIISIENDIEIELTYYHNLLGQEIPDIDNFRGFYIKTDFYRNGDYKSKKLYKY